MDARKCKCALLPRQDTVTDGKGQVATYDYDALDRVELISYQGGAAIDYGYDDVGNVRTMIDNTGTSTYEYDKLNRLTKETLPGPKINEYTYDAGGNLTSFTDAGGTVGYVYNGVNNVTSVTEPGVSPVVLDYHDDHLRKRISYPNGVTQCFWYDFSDRIEFVWSQRSTDCTKDNQNPPPRITDYSYVYKHPSTQQDTGLIRKVTDKAGNATTYSYDALNRLQQAATVGPAAKTFAYSYDHNSNRLTQTVDGGPPTSYAYNDADQLTSAGGITYSYDQNGNEDLTSAGRDFAYNAKDQVSSVVPATGQPAIAMSYTGEGQFDRVSRGPTSFSNSGLGLSREDTTSYTRDPDGFLLAQRNGSKLYFLYDGLGSVVATTTEAGVESAIARYEPFGACANCPTGPYRWLGGLGVYFDAVTQLYKMGTRYYDPALGRFTQVDPVEGGSANEYDYAAQDPMNNVDPSGEWCIGWKCGKENIKSAGKAVASGGRAVGKAAGSIVKRTAKPVAYSLFFGYGCYEVGKGTLKAIERHGGGKVVIRNGRIFLKRDPRFTLGLVALGCGVAITGKFEEVVKAAR